MKNIFEEKPKKVYNIPFSFSDNSSRSFNCNAIVFINSGTVNVSLNDIFLLVPGASIALNGNQNEIDSTIYKITFSAAAGTKLLQGWQKYDAGITTEPPYPKYAFYTKEPNKKDQDKARAGHTARKGEKNNRWNNKLKSDF